MRRTRGEGTLVQRKDGRWSGSLQLGGKRYWVYGKTRKEAVEHLHALQRQQAEGLLVEPSRLTVGDLLRDWLESCRLTCKPSTIHGYEDVIRCHLLPTVGSVKLQKLAPQHIARLYQSKRQSLSDRRVRIIHAVLHRALAEAVRWRLLPRNVADDVTPPRQVQHEVSVWGLGGWC